MNYYDKYLKYKNKYLKLKYKIEGGGKRIRYPNNTNLLNKFNLPVYKEGKYDNSSMSEYKNKIVINTHGSQLVDPEFYKIKVPENFVIYFQSENGETCRLDDDVEDNTTKTMCYNDFEFIQSFKNIEFGYYQDNFSINERPLYSEREWINKHVGNSVIYDCMLSGDSNKKLISSQVISCSHTIETQVLIELGSKDIILLSQILQYIQYKINKNNLEPHIDGKYHIFCSFCLENDTSSPNIKNEILRIQRKNLLNLTKKNITAPVKD